MIEYGPPKTYGEALEKGYTIYDSKYDNNCYVKRDTIIEQLPIQIGKRQRSGELYVNLPCEGHKGSERVYLRMEGGEK